MFETHSQGGEWKCTIKLKREYGRSSDTNEVETKLGEIHPEEVFATINNPADVAPFVSAAQAVLLNPKIAARAMSIADFCPITRALDGTVAVKAGSKFAELPLHPYK